MPLALLVGAYHRPPAAALLAALSQGASLDLVPEPDNPYDAQAIQVWLTIDQLPTEGEALANLELALPGFGSSLDEVLAEPQWMLGYLAATGGKPLAQGQIKTGLRLAGNVEIGPLIQAGAKASLEWGPGGEPLVRVEPGQEPSQEPGQ